MNPLLESIGTTDGFEGTIVSVNQLNKIRFPNLIPTVLRDELRVHRSVLGVFQPSGYRECDSLLNLIRGHPPEQGSGIVYGVGLELGSE
jgi:hypothetical protein